MTTPSRDSSWLHFESQGFYDASDPDFDQQLLKENNLLYILYLLLLSRQTNERELVKEFEGDAITIISKLHHYHHSQM